MIVFPRSLNNGNPDKGEHRDHCSENSMDPDKYPCYTAGRADMMQGYVAGFEEFCIRKETIG
jgi:hypothetical protein